MMSWKPEWEPLEVFAEKCGVGIAPSEEVFRLATENRYDGPLSGYALYRGVLYLFDTLEDDYWRRIFGLYEISEDQIEEIRKRISFLSGEFPRLVTEEGEKFVGEMVSQGRISPVGFEVSCGKPPKVNGSKNPLKALYCFVEEPSEEVLERGDQFYSLVSDFVTPKNFRALLSGFDDGVELNLWSEDFKRHAEMGIYNDGSYCLSLVDDEKDPKTEEDEWYQCFEGSIEEGSLELCAQKTREFLGG